MTNIEEFVQEKRQGRPYRPLPSPEESRTTLSVQLGEYGSFLLEKLGQQWSEAPDALASELLTAALIDAWTAAGNPMPADDEISEHYGTDARKGFDERG